MSTQTLNTTRTGNVAIEATDIVEYAAVAAHGERSRTITVEPTDGADTFDVTVDGPGVHTVTARLTGDDLGTLHAWSLTGKPVGTIAATNDVHVGAHSLRHGALAFVLIGGPGASDIVIVAAADLPALAAGIFTVAAHAQVADTWTPAPDTCGVPVFDLAGCATPCDGDAPAGFDRCDEHADAWTR